MVGKGIQYFRLKNLYAKLVQRYNKIDEEDNNTRV